MNRLLQALLLLCFCLPPAAQNGPLGAIDRYTRQTRIGRAGVQPSPDPFTSPETQRSIPLDLPDVPRRWAVSEDFWMLRSFLDNDLKADAAALLGSGFYHPSDTLDFLCGTTLFSLKELDGAATWFSRVPEGSPFHDESLFYEVVSLAHLRRFAQGQSLLESYQGPFRELSALQQAGLALLQDDPDAYRRAEGTFTYGDFRLEEAENTLRRIYTERFETTRKYPAVAAMLSAVVPGAGKLYAGQIGEGVASFLSVGTFAAMTAENWIRKGPRDWRTILLGSATAVLHLANIYGSWFSVSLYYDELHTDQDATILYHIHIPLRQYFR